MGLAEVCGETNIEIREIEVGYVAIGAMYGNVELSTRELRDRMGVLYSYLYALQSGLEGRNGVTHDLYAGLVFFFGISSPGISVAFLPPVFTLIRRVTRIFLLQDDIFCSASM